MKVSELLRFLEKSLSVYPNLDVKCFSVDDSDYLPIDVDIYEGIDETFISIDSIKNEK